MLNRLSNHLPPWLAVLGMVLLCASAAGAETLTYTLEAGPYDIARDAEGFDRMSMEGFALRAAPGNPLLPAREYKILLPPDADFSTVHLRVGPTESRILPGSFEIGPAAPDRAMVEGKLVEEWAGATNRMDGKNMDVYGANTFFPADVVKLAPKAMMRQYLFMRVELHPFQYNPATRALRHVSRVEVNIEFERETERPQAMYPRDTSLDKEAPELFYNYEDARPWYTPPAGADQPGDSSSYSLLIVTTNSIKGASTLFDDFVASKRSRGITVKVITETQYNGSSGSERADKIRNWIKSNYAAYGIMSALLIGDPTPGGSGIMAVPMKTCWPHGADATPTDMYFAELSGDFDGDNDGTYGEWSDYYNHGDPDLYPEVRVGRIPVYNSNIANLDSILQKIMSYQSTTASIAWRKATLLPMSFSEAGYDGAPLAEQLWDDSLSANGYSRYRMYQQGNSPCAAANSAYAGDEELRGDTVRNRWQNNDYGIVSWWGHGSSTGASVGYDGCWDGTLFSSAQCTSLDNAHPAAVFQNSCTNGYPEDTGNLGYSLLLQGAIGTYSASRVSWFNTGVGYGGFDGSSTNSGIAYEVTRRVALNDWLGSALHAGKSAVVPDIGDRDTRLMNQYDFNLYGDPTVALNDQDTSSICQTLNDALGNYSLTFINGGNALWFCEQAYSAPLGGGDAVQSGDITNNQSSTFSTQVTGPGVVTFHWKVSSEVNYDKLIFLKDGVEQDNISGTVDWEQKTYNVSSGVHTLSWEYRKDASYYAGMDCGWVDYVIYCTTPPAPASISYPSTDSDGNFEVSWASVPGASSYTLSRFAVGALLGFIVYDGPDTSWQQTDLADGDYYYQVSATDSCGTGPVRTGGTITVCNVADAPASLTYPSSDTDGDFEVSWAAVPGASSYRLSRFAVGAIFGIIVYTGPNTSWQQANLDDGDYYYRVSASNSCGYGPSLAGATVTVCNVPTGPDTLTYPSTDTNGDFDISWSAAPGATSYLLCRFEADPGHCNSVYVGPDTSWHQTGLGESTYHYGVLPSNSCGYGVWKIGDNITICYTLPAPASLAYPTRDSDGDFVISWAEVAGAASYTLERAADAGFTTDVTTCYTGADASWHQTGLAPGDYWYRVTAEKSCGSTSPWKTGSKLFCGTGTFYIVPNPSGGGAVIYLE